MPRSQSSPTTSASRRVRVASLAAAALIMTTIVSVGSPLSAQAIPPFPILDDTTGPAGSTNPNWQSVVSGANPAGNTYTSDGWLRLTNAGRNQATNILNAVAFPSSTGFVVDFDLRQAGGTTHSGDAFPPRSGDGMSMYLVDGSAPVSPGGYGGGLGYSGNSLGCGVTGGYVGVGFDVYGNFAAPNPSSTGGPGTSPSMIGVRGSGTQPCTDPAVANYPWVDGASVPNLWTGVAGSTTDPATVPTSLYRHVQVTVEPGNGSVALSVAISDAVAKDQPYSALTDVLDVDLASVPGQAPIPATLKLGFGSSTGGATDFHDIRGVRVSAFTDAAITKALSASTPGNPSLAAGHFLPGDEIGFTIAAVNNGPTIIGNPPDGVARVFDDLSSLPLEDVSWTCTPSAGSTCVTPSGTGSVISAGWAAPPEGSVVIDVSATISADAAAGTFANTAIVPTDFTNNTVGAPGSPVQEDEAAVESDTTNNTATTSFVVDRPLFTQSKSADETSYAVGQAVVYSITVTNTGTAPGTATVTDAVPASVLLDDVTCLPTGTATCTATSTANDITGSIVAGPGESVIFTITGQAIAVGSATNTAQVTPTDPFCATGCGGGPASTSQSAVVATALTLTKTALSDGLPVTTLSLGSVVDYRYDIVNSGQLPIDDIVLTELSFTGSGVPPVPTCPATTLMPGAAMTCSADYTIVQGDIDTESFENTAQATGHAPETDVLTSSNTATVVLPIPAEPSMHLEKRAQVVDEDRNGLTDVGDSVVWIFTIVNMGNITLSDLEVDDPTAGSITCDATTLAPDATTSCRSLPHTITAGEANSGSITNHATASAVDARGTKVVSGTATAVVNITKPAPAPLAATGPAGDVAFSALLALMLLGLGAAAVALRPRGSGKGVR